MRHRLTECRGKGAEDPLLYRLDLNDMTCELIVNDPQMFLDQPRERDLARQSDRQLPVGLTDPAQRFEDQILKRSEKLDPTLSLRRPVFLLAPGW